MEGQIWIYGVICLLALILDGVDGKVARATDSATDFGARFDMELDSLFALGLCLAVVALDKAGIWVLAIGLMRYAFLVAGYWVAFIRQPLPESFRRKTICVWQLATLIVAVLPVIPAGFATPTLKLALALLCYSFFTDLFWLYKRRKLSSSRSSRSGTFDI